MPVKPPRPFWTYEPTHFYIGGNVRAVETVGKVWKKYGEACEEGSKDMRGLDASKFLGSEGDLFSGILNEDLPAVLDEYADVYKTVGDAITNYAGVLAEAKSKMAKVKARAERCHANLKSAVFRYNKAEAVYLHAVSVASSTRASAALTFAIIPTSIGMAVVAEIWRQKAQAEFIAAEKHYQSCLLAWETVLQEALQLREYLGDQTRQLANIVKDQSLKLVDANQNGVDTVILDPLVSIFEDKGVAGILQDLSTGLINIGHEVKESIDGGIDAVGDAASLAFNSAKTLAMKSVAEIYEHSPEAFKKMVGRGIKKFAIGEPVDAASGDLVETVIDISVSGTLPLVVSRQYCSSFATSQIGGSFGLGWISSLDCHLEVFDDRVVLMAPDGAVVRFDAPSADGSEVRGQGREWLLSFVDGAYRVRDVASGVVYTFVTHGDTTRCMPYGPVGDDEFGRVTTERDLLQRKWIEHGIRPTGFGRGSSTVAAVLGQGITVGLSLLVHRSGMWIEYVRDDSTGCISRLIRSDGTVVEVSWDQWLNRVTELRVSHQEQQELEKTPFRQDAIHAEKLDDAPDNDESQSSGNDGMRVGFRYSQLGLLSQVIDPLSSDVRLAYEYDDRSLLSGWIDSNGVGYWHIYDEYGRVVAQSGSGGVYANAFVWLEDISSDAPAGGRVCVMIETAAISEVDMLEIGDEVVTDRLERLQELPLVKALHAGGLQAAGLVGKGRDGARTEITTIDKAILGAEETIPLEWLYDEVLGDIRPSVWRSTADGDVWRTVDALGVATDYIYNDCHQIIGIVGADNGVVELVRNETGQVIETLYPDGSGTRVETGVWGQPVTVTSTAGLSVEYELDSVGNVISVTDTTGQVTRMEYKWLISGVVPWKVISPEGGVTIFECDAAGRVIATENEQGARWSVTRNIMGKIVEVMNPLGEISQIRYSLHGHPIELIASDGSSQSAEYDAEGNLIRFVNETGAETKTKYTVFDKPFEVVDAAGGITKMVYNTQLEVVGMINADGHRWDYRYDRGGQLTMESDYNDLATKYEYDQMHNIVRIIDPDGGINTVYTDKLGKTTKTVDSSGRETKYLYTKHGWLDSIVTSDTTITYVRDDYGRLEEEHTSLVTGESIVSKIERDMAGRCTATVMNVAGHVTRQQYTYHDVTRELTGISVFHNTPYPAPMTVGASSASTALIGDGMGLVGSIDVGVDDLKRRNRFGIGVVDRMLEFDTKGRLAVDITAAVDPQKADGFTVIAGRQFTWRADDALIGVNDALAGSSVFDVDRLGRVKSIHHDRTTAQQAKTDTFGTNFTDRGVSVGLHPTGSSGIRDVFSTEQYSYTAAGQLNAAVSPEYLGGGEMLPRSRAEVESGYEPSVSYNRVMKNTLVTQVGKTRYSYDALGRVIRSVTKRISRKPLVKHYQYAASTGQVTKFSSSDRPHLVWEYTYDGLGRRIAKTCSDTTTNTAVVKVMFGYLGDQLVTEHYIYGCDTDGTIARAWITDPKSASIVAQLTTAHTVDKDQDFNIRIEKEAAAKEHWMQQSTTTELLALVTDLAGAPREIINSITGNVIGRSVQTLYGQRNWKGDVTCPLLFTGQYHDNESDLVYNRYRYYDPIAGIYTSQDPLGQTPNLATPQGYTKTQPPG